MGNTARTSLIWDKNRLPQNYPRAFDRLPFPLQRNTLLLPQKFLTTSHRVIVDIFIVSTDTIILCEAAWAVGVACEKQPFLLAPRRWGRFAKRLFSQATVGGVGL